MAKKKKKRMNDMAIRKGIALEDHHVLIRPIISEKGTHLADRHNIYCFEVHSQANKGEIKRAVEQLFDVRVVDVRTQLRKGKTRRFKMKIGHLPDWKKAYVKLSEEHRITLF